MGEHSAPQHHDQPMYPDWHEGTDMRRWLCAEPGCTASLADEQLAAIRDQDWAEQHGMIAPGWQSLTDLVRGDGDG